MSEGLVNAGAPRILPSSRMAPPGSGQGMVGRGGRLYGRQGLTQPVLEVPFYWFGQELDNVASHGRRTSGRLAIVRLYNPFMAALTVLAMVALFLFRGVAERRALVVAGIAGVGTLIWPYAKIGMDTTLMATVAGTFAASAFAARRPTPGRYGLVGIAAGLTINSKPYGAFLLVGVIPLLWEPFMTLSPRQRASALACLAIPLVAAAGAGAWYNWYRTGSTTNFMNTYIAAPVAAPISALGLYLSPGKGLLWYSPLVILGIIGFRDFWRSDRRLAFASILTIAANTIVVAISLSWTDETWGPRYIVPSAWLLILPIAWWLRKGKRFRWFAVVAILGVCIQCAAVLTSYGAFMPVASTLSGGEYVYPYAHPGARVAYGDDGPRWIPGDSPLLFQLELAAAYVKEQVTGSGFRVSYHPYRGNWATVDLTHPDRTFAPLPDFWWAHTSGWKVRWLAVVLGVLAVASAVMLPRGIRTRWS